MRGPDLALSMMSSSFGSITLARMTSADGAHRRDLFRKSCPTEHLSCKSQGPRVGSVKAADLTAGHIHADILQQPSVAATELHLGPVFDETLIQGLLRRQDCRERCGAKKRHLVAKSYGGSENCHELT